MYKNLAIYCLYSRVLVILRQTERYSRQIGWQEWGEKKVEEENTEENKGKEAK